MVQVVHAIEWPWCSSALHSAVFRGLLVAWCGGAKTGPIGLVVSVGRSTHTSKCCGRAVSPVDVISIVCKKERVSPWVVSTQPALRHWDALPGLGEGESLSSQLEHPSWVPPSQRSASQPRGTRQLQLHNVERGPSAAPCGSSIGQSLCSCDRAAGH